MAATSRTVNGDGTYPTAAQTAVSFTPTAVGTYTFVAKYDSGSVNTNSIGESACPDTTGTETVTVTDTTSVTSQQDWLPNDTATVTADAVVSWLVTYDDSNSNVADSAPVCETTSLTINNNVPVGPPPGP
jgi:hypothetical protein